ncbi:unnamed protein product [Rotaria magnacalcarata]|uniref:Uncharacterized protein n=1 Tax=Rotaria magnacalcarata TaxID=392030 RepID=A0A816B241_9BILA|nr:unnamed protein product [Rotaria magnacalcarata]CAF1605677.1 unnamed protein product [Rotaria magnacalcarata]CAF3801881.1 unnamed protein product [Rotaria magnacalcarata]CAF3869918.1 unnamed protein product [Rotaria magnacalcarata]
MSRLEVLLIVLIPLYADYDVVSTNSIAFFVLYDLFSKFYNNENLKYRKWSVLSFWSLILFATVTVMLANVEFILLRIAKEDPLKEKDYHHKAQIMKYTSRASEIVATIACYVLIALQLIPKTVEASAMETEHDEDV